MNINNAQFNIFFEPASQMFEAGNIFSTHLKDTLNVWKLHGTPLGSSETVRDLQQHILYVL